ncbi:hypothetical protein VPH35_109473 [Triticum aestivum]
MACTPAAAGWALPADLLLEIIERSSIQTLIRCAASCKLLRRDILEPHFVRRIHIDVPPLSLVHPATPSAVSFFKHHLFPSVSRGHGGLLGEYCPVMSRGGLVLLCRHSSHASNSLLDLCVYDPVNGLRTFISKPPGIPDKRAYFRKFILLTAADGISCSFLLFFRKGGTPRPLHQNDAYGPLINQIKIDTTWDIVVQTFTSSTGAWGPVGTCQDMVQKRWFDLRFDPVVLEGGVIHWLRRDGRKMFTYNVHTTELGMVPVPGLATADKEGQLQLRPYSSPDGHMLLRLLAITGFMVSVWHHSSGSGWALDTSIDMEEKLRSTLDHHVHPDRPPYISFSSSTERSNAVLLKVHLPCRDTITQRSFHFTPVLLDLETKEMQVKHLVPSSMLVEFDMSSRLQAMKIFP